MTSDYKELIDSLKANVNTCKDKYLKLKKELESVREENKELVLIIEKQKKEILTLQDKYETLNLARGVTSRSGDNETAKKQVNRIVREIDNCIALLNK